MKARGSLQSRLAEGESPRVSERRWLRFGPLPGLLNLDASAVVAAEDVPVLEVGVLQHSVRTGSGRSGRGFLPAFGEVSNEGQGNNSPELASRSRKGPWRMSHNSIVQRGLTDRWLAEQGVPSIREQWIALRYPNPVT